MMRPFRKFTFIWCLLIVFSAHRYILVVATTVLLLHLARKIYIVIAITWSSRTAIEQTIDRLIGYLKENIDALANPDVSGIPIKDLRNLVNKLRGIEYFLRFVANTAAFWLSTMIVAATLLLSTYLYFAGLFSFAYVGVSRIVGESLTFANALVTSVFIPFFVVDLPKALPVRILGGIHCTLVVTLGAGAAMNYFRRQLVPLRNTALALGVRMSEENVRERYLLIQEKIKSADNLQKADSSKNTTE
jgi:hypothetical protein